MVDLSGLAAKNRPNHNDRSGLIHVYHSRNRMQQSCGKPYDVGQYGAVRIRSMRPDNFRTRDPREQY